MAQLPDSIEISWSIDDIIDLRPDLNPEQCREVLQEAKRRHDAGIGITWEVLRVHAETLFPLEA